MKFLLDTHLLIWIPVADPRISSAARAILTNPEHDFAFSAASLWELSIKRSLGKLDPAIQPRTMRREFLDAGFEELPVLSEHALAVESLPLLHRDPFDRLLLAQAMVEGITLLTVDETLARYNAPVFRV